jgi:hypothetical protein
MLKSSVPLVILHDHVRQHTAARIPALLELFNWELFDYPPYSPYIARSDYHLCAFLKNWFGSQRFTNNKKLMEDVETRLN